MNSDNRRKRRKPSSEKDPAVAHHQQQKETSSDTTSRPSKKRRKRNKNPLNGMIVAVSTLDVKGQSHTDSQSSYKAVSDQCQNLGATITGQLHRRVSCLVCNQTAVQNATQRVRKAIKKKVPIVDAAWIRQCKKEEKLVDMEPFRLDDVAVKVIESRKVKGSEVSVVAEDSTGVDDVPDSAWSEPASLGCCCVCHENGDDDCPWCTNCSMKQKSSKTS
jgi:hypothetical protein